MKQFCNNCVYNQIPSQTIKLKQNEYIFFEGDNIDNVYKINNGLVKISKSFLEGEERIFDILGKDDFIALVSVLKKDTKYIATALTLTDTELDVIPKQDVLNAYQKNNEFKDMCLNCTITRTHLFQSHLFNTTSASTEEKIIIILEHLMKKFGKYQDKKYILELPFSKTILANIIGIRRETLSRKLSILENQNILKVNKNTYIFNRM